MEIPTFGPARAGASVRRRRPTMRPDVFPRIEGRGVTSATLPFRGKKKLPPTTALDPASFAMVSAGEGRLSR